MAKYELEVSSIRTFENCESCFEDLVKHITEAENVGFRLVKIKDNSYTLMNRDNYKKVIFTIRKDEQ